MNSQFQLNMNAEMSKFPNVQDFDTQSLMSFGGQAGGFNSGFGNNEDFSSYLNNDYWNFENFQTVPPGAAPDFNNGDSMSTNVYSKNGPMSVSYTHLDVYKRQIQY